jgi:hypothetical protein
MILFVPAHDSQTYSNLAIAQKITGLNDICLFENDAIKSELLQILTADFAENTDRNSLFVMSHGEGGSFDDNQRSLLFVEKTEIRLLNDRKCFVYACLTANESGRFIAQNLSNNSVYWAYTGSITAPPIVEIGYVDEAVLAEFIPIFTFIKNSFNNCHTEKAIHEFLQHLKNLCEQAADNLDIIGDFDQEIYACLNHIWGRLCVFIGGNKEDIRHIEAETGYLF